MITSTQYLLGVRAEAPADLAIFAKMNAWRHAARTRTIMQRHGAPAADPASPVTSPVPIRMTAALGAPSVVAAILADLARKDISRDPAKEAVILVAHGPVPDDDNRRWLRRPGRRSPGASSRPCRSRRVDWHHRAR